MAESNHNMAGLNLTLQAGTAPALAPLPGNAQALLNFIAAYVLIAGGQNFNGINFGSTTPAPANRGIPWFKTDQNNNPIGLFAWNGATWAAIPTTVSSGPTGSRPSNPSVGTQYLDTTIGAAIYWSSNGWTTVGGCVGDVKEVQAADLNTALNNNPGWVQDTQSVGLVIGGAGGATGITAAHPYGQVIGEENHVLSIAETPSHTHALSGSGGWAPYSGQHQNGTQPPGVFPVVTGVSTSNSAATGGGGSHNTIQPTIYYWRLVKQF